MAASLTHSDFNDRGRGNHILDEAAYARGTQDRIRENARKGRGARWMAEDPTREALIARLRREATGGFMLKMMQSYEEWFSLTDGQERAVRASFAKADARRAEMRACDAGSQHVGTVGKRQEFSLTVRAVKEITGNDGNEDFVWFVLTIFADEAGNVLVYKGNKLGEKSADGRAFTPIQRGDTVALKATVKAHSDRDGVRQTTINRPAISSVTKQEA